MADLRPSFSIAALVVWDDSSLCGPCQRGNLADEVDQPAKRCNMQSGSKNRGRKSASTPYLDEQDISSGLGESNGYRLADAPRGTRDEGRLPLQREH